MTDENPTSGESQDVIEDDQVTLSSKGESSQDQSSQGNNTEQSSNVEALVAQIERLQAELAKAKEDALRAVADSQNAQRRAQLDVEKAHKFGSEKFVSDMLPVVDNLQRAIDASKADGVEMVAVTEGVELTLKSLQDGLKRQNVEQVNPLGEPFNPELHQAMSVVESPDAEPNTVINVFQPGYTLYGRLVRPAMVVVSKAPA